MSDLSWRPMKTTDLQAVIEISEQAHPLFPEEPHVFAEKQRQFEAFCFTLEYRGAVTGYCLAHPWERGRVPALNRLLGSPLHTPDCLFIHDVALAREARGKGASVRLVEILADVAQCHGLKAITLVALYGSGRLWSRQGFVATEIEKQAIKSYGPSAIYMVKTLS
jgi:GNAT superfamily N-acetyltransferase